MSDNDPTGNNGNGLLYARTWNSKAWQGVDRALGIPATTNCLARIKSQAGNSMQIDPAVT